MDFSGLKYSYNRWVNNGEPIQNKQRLNISERTKAILLNDQDVFHTQNGFVSTLKADEQKLSSHIINHIFRCYKYDAHASLEHMLEIEKSRISDVLKEMNSTQRETAIKFLLNNKREELIAENILRTKRKGVSFTFNVDKDNIEHLVSDEAQREKLFYNDSIGDYIKTVLEEYADRSFVERERIFYKDVLEKIHTGLNTKKVLKLYLHSTTSINGELKRTIVYMKPYGVYQDSELLYNYLVGMINNDHGSAWSVGSIRLSSIQRCECLSDDAIIHKKDAAQINLGLKIRGIQYLSDKREIQKIVIQLDPEGEKMYQKMLHLRPMYINKRDNAIYEFECTSTQAEFYFFKFGHHVKILEPANLASKFARKYRSAARQYLEE
ncbi:MAG: WYL domain-containing protein [Clostridia bacterium]|nr:WYL domain-containing protein [Clostridia bacterium]